MRRKKSERGELDLGELIILMCVFIALVFGVGPCRDCFYQPGECAPMQKDCK